MSTREEIIAELETLAPALAALKRREAMPQAPPDGYWEGLAGKVLGQAPVAKPRAIRIGRWQWLAAAVLLLALLAVGTLMRPPAQAPPQAELLPAEAEQYIHAHIDEFSAALLVDMLEASETAAAPGEAGDSMRPVEEDYLDYLDAELLELLL